MREIGKILIIFVITLLLFCPFVITADTYSASEKAYIRVAILQDEPSVNLKVHGFYEIEDGDRQKLLSRRKNLKTTVCVSADGISIGGTDYKNNKIFIKTDQSGAIVINGRRFRGNIQLVRKDNQRLLVVNYLELEDYLKGILYHEVSHYWPKEVLKAQAVVSRSYVLYQAKENAHKPYDVSADIYSQVYGGRTSERYRTNRAVKETQGEVLTYRGKIFPAYFHATCAGHTEDAAILWNMNIAPLKGLPCNFCRESPHYAWHYVSSLDELKEKLARAGYNIKEITDIAAQGTDASGRITELKITADNKEIKILAKDFRNIIGPNILRSTKFNVRVVNHDIVFEGSGWGHGVGMCQWGAYFMAKAGRNYKEILRYYYPGSDVKTLGF